MIDFAFGVMMTAAALAMLMSVAFLGFLVWMFLQDIRKR